MDLYVHISQPVVISVQGQAGAEVHLAGYVEPSQDAEDNEMMEGMDMDEEDEDFSDEDSE